MQSILNEELKTQRPIILCDDFVFVYRQYLKVQDITY